MKILVSGYREMMNYQLMKKVLSKHHPTIIIQGGAKGADHLARLFAAEFQIKWKTYHAEWRKHGNRAGPVRNQFMLDVESPDLVIAFPHPKGSGTQDLIRRARHMGFSVEEHTISDEDCQVNKR